MHAACRGEGERLCRLGGRGAERAEHVKHVVHVPDAGGVPAQGLVEGLRVLPRVASRAHVRGGLRAGRWEAGSGTKTSAVCARGVCTQRAGERAATADIGGEARGEARTSNMKRMFVTREVSKLRGWLKADACCRGSQAGHTRCGAGCGPGGGWRQACKRARLARSGQGRGLRLCRFISGAMRARGAAHGKHELHVRDAGGVQAQGLVEGLRDLPRVASRAHGAGRAAGPEAGGRRRAAGTGRGEQRTANMLSMFVTREVSQPEVSALKLSV